MRCTDLTTTYVQIVGPRCPQDRWQNASTTKEPMNDVDIGKRLQTKDRLQLPHPLLHLFLHRLICVHYCLLIDDNLRCVWPCSADAGGNSSRISVYDDPAKVKAVKDGVSTVLNGRCHTRRRSSHLSRVAPNQDSPELPASLMNSVGAWRARL